MGARTEKIRYIRNRIELCVRRCIETEKIATFFAPKTTFYFSVFSLSIQVKIRAIKITFTRVKQTVEKWHHQRFDAIRQNKWSSNLIALIDHFVVLHNSFSHFLFHFVRLNYKNSFAPSLLLVVPCRMGAGKKCKQTSQFHSKNTNDTNVSAIKTKQEKELHCSGSGYCWLRSQINLLSRLKLLAKCTPLCMLPVYTSILIPSASP